MAPTTSEKIRSGHPLTLQACIANFGDRFTDLYTCIQKSPAGREPLMTFFRPAIDIARQMWCAIDTANALRHGAPISDSARRYCMTQPEFEVRAVA